MSVIYQIVNNKNMIYINDLSYNISIYEVTPSKKLKKYDYYINPFLYFKDNIHEYTNKLTVLNLKSRVYPYFVEQPEKIILIPRDFCT